MASTTTDLSSKGNGLASDFKSKVLNSEHQLEKMAHTAGDKMSTMASNIGSATSDSIKAGQEYVKENPVKGVALAVATGLVAGALFTMIMNARRS
jgi:ElaB/YqjD/DUF883 family membrane-anchored ribosome-binding protein